MASFGYSKKLVRLSVLAGAILAMASVNTTVTAATPARAVNPAAYFLGSAQELSSLSFDPFTLETDQQPGPLELVMASSQKQARSTKAKVLAAAPSVGASAATAAAISGWSLGSLGANGSASARRTTTIYGPVARPDQLNVALPIGRATSVVSGAGTIDAVGSSAPVVSTAATIAPTAVSIPLAVTPLVSAPLLTTATDPVESAAVFSTAPPVRVPYRPPLRSPYRPPL